MLLCAINGIGDKLLDVIGASVVSEALGKTLYVNLNPTEKLFCWGPSYYDSNLFEFKNIIVHNDSLTSDEKIICTHASASLSPAKVFTYLRNFTFEHIIERFRTHAKYIRPSEFVCTCIPDGIENAYGIHLRMTDKIIHDGGNHTIENSSVEYDKMFTEMFNHITHIVHSEENPVFFIGSEDVNYKNEIKQKIYSLNTKVKFIEHQNLPETQLNGFDAVLDMFTLSRCKCILQNVKYSTFSIAAAMIGGIKLLNF